MLIAIQHVGQRKRYDLSLADDNDAEHPVAGKPEWCIVAHRRLDGAASVRPLAKVEPSDDGHAAVIESLCWPGRIEIEVSVEALHPFGSDPLSVPRSSRFTKKIVVVIPEIQPLSDTLALRVVPEGVTPATDAPIAQFRDLQLSAVLH
jgi:hypothetical protein